jgi:hypothetical protein
MSWRQLVQFQAFLAHSEDSAGGRAVHFAPGRLILVGDEEDALVARDPVAAAVSCDLASATHASRKRYMHAWNTPAVLSSSLDAAAG